MKKYLFYIFFSLSVPIIAQVGINTNNPNATLHIDGGKDNIGSGIPSANQIYNDVVFTSDGNIGVGTLNPSVRLDTRSVVGSDNSIGIGQTTRTAADAGAGAIRYNTYNGGKMQYSDGVRWEDLLSVPLKSIVVCNVQAAPFAIKIPYEVETGITSWTELRDSTGNFNPSTNEFTAPRTGIYLVSFNYDFVRIPVTTSYYTEARFIVNGNNLAKKCIKTHQNANVQAQVGLGCVAGIPLNKGDVLSPVIYQSVYSSSALSLRTGISGAASNNDYGFINLSIMEQ